MRTALLERSELKQFTKIRTWRWLVAVACEWAVIIATIWAVTVIGGWLIIVPAVIVIGSRQHALGALAHDGSHHLVARNHKVNDVLSDLLAAYPNGFTTAGFRTTHLRHHAFLETEKDPSRVTVDLFPRDWIFPMPKRRVATIIARDFTGLSQASSSLLLKYLWEIPGGRGRHLAQLIAYHVVAIALFVSFDGLWIYGVLWVLPLFTAAIGFYRIRAVAEHSGLDAHLVRYLDDSADPLSATRTTVHRNPLTRFFLSPHNISYHIEHHLYPSVPVFDLKRLHARLFDVPEYTNGAHITEGHGALFRELTTTVDREPVSTS